MRYYRVEYLDYLTGWTLVPGTHKKKRQEAINLSKEVAEEKKCPTRVKRAPRKWKPEEENK